MDTTRTGIAITLAGAPVLRAKLAVTWRETQEPHPFHIDDTSARILVRDARLAPDAFSRVLERALFRHRLYRFGSFLEISCPGPSRHLVRVRAVEGRPCLTVIDPKGEERRLAHTSFLDLLDRDQKRVIAHTARIARLFRNHPEPRPLLPVCDPEIEKKAFDDGRMIFFPARQIRLEGGYVSVRKPAPPPLETKKT